MANACIRKKRTVMKRWVTYVIILWRINIVLKMTSVASEGKNEIITVEVSVSL